VLIAPGLLPTSILLPLIPLLMAELIQPVGIIADSLSGVSGRGARSRVDYPVCDAMKASGTLKRLPEHRICREIEEQLSFAAEPKATSSSRRI